MKCAIIKDLLPVYCDGLASDETKEEVEKHLAECDECRNICKSMKEAVPEIQKPDIKPMKKIKNLLRLRTFLLLIVVLGIALWLPYNFLCVNPVLANSESISYEYDSLKRPDHYDYYLNSISPTKAGENRCFALDIPNGSEFVIDEENNCVWLDGKKAEAGTDNGKTIYVPADGQLIKGGILRLYVKCDTVFNAIRYEYEKYPTMNTFVPTEATLSLRPCLPFRQDMNQCLDGENNTFRAEFYALECGEGATFTIKCRDKDIVIDLHELAVKEGILSE